MLLKNKPLISILNTLKCGILGIKIMGKFWKLGSCGDKANIVCYDGLSISLEIILLTTVSHKLKGSFDGALAGGGDPASSPLYVFGPFLQLIVGAGVASITFGASVWMAVLTVFTVAAVYKLVMKWIIDGSGGSGLCEEEFGSWAVKINSGITVIEYSLTFLVSVSALVTFLADRFPSISNVFLGYSIATYVAIFLVYLLGLV